MKYSTATIDAHQALVHVTASAVIEQEGRFLLVEEIVDDQTVINQPSGHVEDREFPIAATVRETLEETGWLYEPQALIGVYFYYSPIARVTYQRICFTGQLIRRESLQPLDHTIQRVLWLTPEQIKNQASRLRSPMVLKCIEDYLCGKRYDLNLFTDLL